MKNLFPSIKNIFPTRFLVVSALLTSAMAMAHAQDIEHGKEVNGTCAACHGDLGQGGKRGEYPRLAGQHAPYLEDQLRAYRSRTRVNIPMFPYTQERELSDGDIRDVSAYLASIELPTRAPAFKDTDDALTRLLAMEKVMIIPRAEGDVLAGGKIFDRQCAGCHGRRARGREGFPMLVGQYTGYLKRQIEIYVKGERPHEEGMPGGILNKLSEKDLNDILAHITTLQEE